MLEADYRGVSRAFEVHGRVVFTYQAQHPSRAKPWMRAAHRAGTNEIFGRGRDWRAVLADNRRSGGVDRSKSINGAGEMPVVGQPVAGEQTIAEIDPAIPAGHVARVEAWARSVAEHRFLGD